MGSICVIIRVYNRVEDLKWCLNIIKDTWINYGYYIIVVSNGKQNGFLIDDETKSKIDCFVELEENTGHLTGNAQLLLEGHSHIPNNCDYTILLEADTWIYSDELIKSYVERLKSTNAVWASAKWHDASVSLATDFAIVQTKLLNEHQQILDFSIDPERYVASYLLHNNFMFIYIVENMPVHVPSYIKFFPYARRTRFNVFPNSKMVTYHIEELKGGIKDKKKYFNILSGKNYFDLKFGESVLIEKIKIRMFICLSYLFPRRSWFKKFKI